ncbi:MAG TPA: VCBS repeat-containing protein [Bryobacteraceae bacterium]|nr:VCBS repeat-containing protein [Bryobacteraceae bacterium]
MVDFDGDGKKDIAVFRPSNGTWYLQGSSQGYWEYQWGVAGDIPVPGDYNGYGRAGAAVFRRFNSTWFISPVGAAPYQVQFGAIGDIPVPGDFDGDGKTDIAVFRPANGTWYIQGSSQGYWEYQWGWAGDIPVPGDYDGDGKVEPAVFRPWNNTWYISTAPGTPFSFGIAGDIPVPGDFDGDGKTDIAVYRPYNGVWYVQSSSQGALQYQWGTSGDVPVPGDYDGDRKIDTAVFRPWNNTWYIFASSTGLFAPIFGASGDMPLTSMYSTYLSAATPTIALTNLTHPDLAPNFEVGDTYRMTITGPPNEPVSVVQTFNGGTSQQTFGNTDAYGHMTVDYVEQTGNIGSYTQVWSVGGIQASPAVSFMVGQLGGGGTISTTELGVTTDGHVVGVSTLSIANGTAGTYSATELDYTASLYYDAGTVDRKGVWHLTIKFFSNYYGRILAALTLISLPGAYLLEGQSIPSANIKTGEPSKARSIPSYLVYRHFMAWALSQENNAKAAGGAGSNDEFSTLLKDARLGIPDLEALRTEAQSLKSDLDREDAKANLVVKLYRVKAKDAAQAGKPLPPPPLAIHQLQQERTAILVQHMMNLQTKLGPEKTARLDAYLNRDFVPRISLKALSHPRANVAAGSPNSFTSTSEQ